MFHRVDSWLGNWLPSWCQQKRSDPTDTRRGKHTAKRRSNASSTVKNCDFTNNIAEEMPFMKINTVVNWKRIKWRLALKFPTNSFPNESVSLQPNPCPSGPWLSNLTVGKCLKHDYSSISCKNEVKIGVYQGDFTLWLASFRFPHTPPDTVHVKISRNYVVL